jgi:curved DNA-binding protein CbpA
MDDYYQALELEKGASPEEIKTNYRRLAMRWHPDRNAGSTEAEEKFKRISEAYAVLSDEGKRRAYDSGGLDYAGSAGAAGQQSWGASPWGNAGWGGQAWGGSPFQGFRPRAFTAEEAESMFMNEMYMLATELTMQNVGWRDIAQELQRRGCPADVAESIAQKMEESRKALIRSRARPAFVRAALSGFFGLVLFGSFAGVGLGILGFLGLIMVISGGYNLVRALWFILTGRAPR